MKQKFVGKYMSFRFKGRKYSIEGVVLDYNDKWTYIRTCVDYTPEGYTVFRNKNVEYRREEGEKRASRILETERVQVKRGATDSYRKSA